MYSYLGKISTVGFEYSNAGRAATTRLRHSSTLVNSEYRRQIDLTGIIVPVPTPFRSDHRQSVDYDKLKENLFRWEKIPLKGYCIGGTNGEWPYLSDEEKLSILKTVKSNVHSSKLVIAGTTCESTARARKVSVAAAEAGADAILLMTPYYFRNQMTEKVIIEHFASIADATPIPLIVYNNPFATSIDINLNTIKILSDHPNICGIKDTDVAKLACIVEKTKDKNFHVLAGSAGYLLPSLIMGCSGGINGLAAILGQSLCEMFSLNKSNELNKALKIQKQLAMPDFLLLRELGPSGLKAAMDMMGYYGGHCRKPLLPINDQSKTRIRKILQKSGFLK